MEFQSKESKRSKTIQLFVGYALVAVLIGLATLILVYLAQGYGYDTNSGVQQSGLVFIDSKPAATEILINNQKSDKRVTLKEGEHSITIKKDKYRDWNKKFMLEGGAVMYFVYPKLFPVDIPIGITKVYPSAPAWVSQSPDRRWLVMQQLANSPNLSIVDLSKPNDEQLSFAIPLEQLNIQKGLFGDLTPIEWSDDNQHLLLSQKMPDGSIGYLIIDRKDNEKTINISNKLGLARASVVSLKDKKYDKYYVLNTESKELREADIKNGLAQTILLSEVISFKPYADNLIIYTTLEGANATEVKVVILSDQTEKYLLKSLPRDPSNRYLLDMAKFENNWYYVTASSQDKFVYLYRNPLKRAEAGNIEPIVPQMSLNLASPQYLSFSDNARFIGMQSGKNFVVFDGELNRVYKYKSQLNIGPTQQAKWMDGHRFSVITDSKVQVFEFDGSNLQTLISSRPESGAYFDRDYKYVFTLINQVDGKVGFENGRLILD